MSKFRRLAGFLITSARVAFAAALVEVGHDGEPQLKSSTARAAAYYAILATMASGSDRGLRDAWHWPEAAAITLERFAAHLIGGPELYAIAAPPLPAFDPDELCALSSQGPVSAFEHRLPFFFAALACGWPLQVALDLFGSLGEGAYTENGCCFCVAGTDAPDANARRHVFTADGFLDGITLWTRDQRIIRIITTRSMAGRRAFLSAGPQPEQGFLPPIIRLARDDASGELIVPVGRVTDIYDARANWDAIVGRSMDATTTAIVHGRLVMPLQSWPTAGLHGRNHPSWENNPEAQAALGPTLANWLYSGKLEYVAPGHRVPIIIEPVGAVPKSSHPLFHVRTTARLGNYIYAAWGSVYHSIDDAAMSLEPFDFFYCVDIVDAYHTVAFAGCAQGIVVEKMIWIDQHGQPHVREQRFLGCSPRTCTAACDKSLSGICIG